MQACHLQQHLSQQEQQLKAPDVVGRAATIPANTLAARPFMCQPAWRNTGRCAVSSQSTTVQTAGPVLGPPSPHLCHRQVHFQHDAVALSARLVKDMLPDCIANPRQASCWGPCQKLQ